jgi:hypothetical protein
MKIRSVTEHKSKPRSEGNLQRAQIPGGFFRFEHNSSMADHGKIVSSKLIQVKAQDPASGDHSLDPGKESPWLLPPTQDYLQAMRDADHVAIQYLVRIWFRQVHGTSAPHATVGGISVRNWTGFHSAS